MAVPSELLGESSELLGEYSSSSTTQRHYRDGVFLSFKGDTRLAFTNHLYAALRNANITTFLDDEELDTGVSLTPELENAIKSSRASIIVLSENYAFSTWCLEELVLILDQMTTSDHIVYPIFYHVNPVDFTKQESSFGIAMANHKQRMEAETNVEAKNELAKKIEKWNKALVEVAKLKGKDAKERPETVLIEEIVTEIYDILCVTLSSSIPRFYGMQDYIKNITSWLEDGSSHSADILTISGPSGIGKTSLARYVHVHSRLFNKNSFIESVNKKCTQQVCGGLLKLQKQLSRDISRTSLSQIHNEFKYTSIIENALARHKVFIVLDDIGSLEQLEALLGKKGFYPGSKIIITTEDSTLNEKYALLNSVVQPKHTRIVLEGLDDQASLQLFSYHAFGSDSPKEGYEKVSKKFVAYSKGHPGVLKAWGESLHKHDVAEWEHRIRGLMEENQEMDFTSMYLLV